MKKKFLEFIDYFKNKEQPIFPIKAEYLIKNFNFSEGKEIGDKLKLLEDFWIKNKFTITKKDIEEIINN